MYEHEGDSEVTQDEQEIQEFRDLANTDQRAVIRSLAKHPALLNHTHRYHKEALELWRIAHGIDKQTRQERQAANEKRRSNNWKRINEIKNDPRWLDHTHPQHKALHREYLSCFWAANTGG